MPVPQYIYFLVRCTNVLNTFVPQYSSFLVGTLLCTYEVQFHTYTPHYLFYLAGTCFGVAQLLSW